MEPDGEMIYKCHDCGFMFSEVNADKCADCGSDDITTHITEDEYAEFINKIYE